MARNDDLLELARHCREWHFVALGVLAYVTADMSDEDVQRAAEWARELRREWTPTDGHLALVRERYGPPAGAEG